MFVTELVRFMNIMFGELNRNEIEGNDSKSEKEEEQSKKKKKKSGIYFTNRTIIISVSILKRLISEW